MIDRINFLKRISSLLFVGALPFWPIISSVLLVAIIVLNTFFTGSKRDRKYQVLWFALPFLGYLISFSYAYDTAYAMSYLLRILPFLLIPILFCFQPPESQPTSKELAIWYTYGVFISACFAFLLAFFSYLRTGDPEMLSYYNLAEGMKLHPTYYALYALTGLYFLWNFKFHKLFRAVATVVLIVLIVMLQTRMAYLLLCLWVPFLLVRLWRQSAIITLLIGALAIIALVWTFQNSQRLSSDFYESLQKEQALLGNENENGVSQRIWLWSEAWAQIREKPVLGYGLKSQHSLFRWKIHKAELSKEHNPEYRDAIWKVSGLNLHNQYMQVLYEGGIFGLLLFVFPFMAIMRWAIKARNGALLYGVGIFAMMLLTENMLDRQMGIYYYAIFLPLLMLSEKRVSLGKTDTSVSGEGSNHANEIAEA